MGFSKIVENLTLALATNSTLASFAITSPTMSTAAIPAGVASINIGGALAAVLMFVGEGSATNTFNYRVSVRSAVYAADGTATGLYTVRCLGYGVATLGSTAVTIGGVAMKVVDTLTFTPANTGTTMKGSLSAFAGARGEDTGTVYSPADGTPAELQLAAICKSGDLLVDFDMVTATSANAAFELSAV